MRIFTRFRAVAAMLSIAFAAALGSCVLEPDTEGPNAKSESVTLKINVPAAPSSTRALAQSDEYAVNDISVLAFDKTDKTFYGRYPGSIVTGPTHTGGSGATLTFEVTLPTGGFDLMIVVNGNKILAANSGALTLGASQASVEAALTMSMGTSGWNTDTGSAGYYGIPLWGYVKAATVPDDFPLASAIRLTRMVAKVNVQLGAPVITANNFQLRSVRVYNYVEQGRLIPDTGGAFDWTAVTQATLADNQTPTLPAGYTKANAYAPDNENLTYTIGTPYKALVNSIYLFEAPVGVAPTPGSDYLDNTCLVIGGRYSPDGGTTWNQESYYRIDFARQTDNAEGLTDYAYLPILRNNSYSVTIASISGDGHNDPIEALESVPTNITANILNWNDHGISTVVTDGIYHLSVSQGSFVFPNDARTAADTDNLLTVATDHYDGWTATVWADEAGIAALPDDGTSGLPWLRITSSGGTGNYPAGNETQLIADENGSGAIRTAYIHIKAGALNYIVKVVQLSEPDPDEFIDEGNAKNIVTYVGAFWRADQTGERVIYIKTEYSNYAGNWAVQVLDYGDYFEKGDIVFLAGGSDDPAIYTGSPGDAESFRVNSTATYAAGTATQGSATQGTPTTDGITFRIGLKERWSDNAAYDPADRPARYARLLVSFGTKDGEEYYYKRVIWLRQGHGDDYVMAPGDPVTVDGVANSNPYRTTANTKKFSPYNLTSRYLNDTDTFQYQIKVSEGERGDFTQYPSQAGALFQFAHKLYPNYAYHPTASKSATGMTWEGGLNVPLSNYNPFGPDYNTCPHGYTRIESGDLGAATTSQLAQSLLLDPAVSVTTSSAHGYYADGYFDRYAIDANSVSGTGSLYQNTSVRSAFYDAAYVGRVFFNPVSASNHHNANIFFSSAGYRADTIFNLPRNAGQYGYYWTGTISSNVFYSFFLRIEKSSLTANYSTERYVLGTIRCVVED